MIRDNLILLFIFSENAHIYMVCLCIEKEWRREIIPDPVGPIKSTLLFSSSTKFSSSSSSDNKWLPILSSLKQTVVSIFCTHNARTSCILIYTIINPSHFENPTFAVLLGRLELCSLQSFAIDAFVMIIYCDREDL